MTDKQAQLARERAAIRRREALRIDFPDTGTLEVVYKEDGKEDVSLDITKAGNSKLLGSIRRTLKKKIVQ